MSDVGHIAETVSTIPLPSLTHTQDALLRAAFMELMATSQAVAAERLASISGVPPELAGAELDRLAHAGRVERAEDGCVTGALGLSIEASRHELLIGSRRWYTWCVIDALGILGALGASGSIRSTVPGSSRSVVVEFVDGHPHRGDLGHVVFVPDYVGGTPVIENWCPAVNFFPDPGSARAWADAASVAGHTVSLDVATAAATDRWRSRLQG